ncbi:MAG: hypothetical protein CXT73_03005 [Methanobacteriota archaeon]|jgi:hypothetical protein|nr:MAG: hypothetical protein CXT73_03005 [Euryarchaeota archaeon]
MYQISSEAYLDRFNECYKNIVVISPKPNDASLNLITRAITREKLSPFQEISPCCPLDRCIYAFVYPNNRCELLCVNDISILFGFLTTNGYTINTELTKVMQESDVKLKNLICFINKN